MMTTDELIGLPPGVRAATTDTRNYFAALENFQRTFAFGQGDKVLLLTDPLLDTRVADAVMGLARARGATVRQYMESTSQVTEVPELVKALVADADFVVSTWFCSIFDPFFIAQRAAGQRWVKITYFRDLDLLHTPQARFPAELVGEIIRATAQRYPAGKDFTVKFSDVRGSDFSIDYTPEMRQLLQAGNRWRGKMFADEPGCYVHYLPTHGPNLWDRTAHRNDANAPVTMSGTLYPQWAVGFAKPFAEKIGCRFESDTIVEVTGESEEAVILREMLVGGRLIELGCGFNPKAPRHTIYPAGSNAPGALHFGIDLAKPSEYILRTMPQWEEPPVHMDLVTLDSTVQVDGQSLIDGGFLTALRDPAVRAAAEKFGNPIELLETAI
ncbi:MAG: hypothetical protein HYX42_21560 [Polaromonas sp.]|uniref:hypothetical protein n=1 Tax=Polaromonas sp. TaxID=1869339 RepID=UPI0025ED3139|nr:hypothetical protein [Polaromonas sp.]MBI2728836.1 hypothetical protein [Polaromonas sp.]